MTDSQMQSNEKVLWKMKVSSPEFDDFCTRENSANTLYASGDSCKRFATVPNAPGAHKRSRNPTLLKISPRNKNTPSSIVKLSTSGHRVATIHTILLLLAASSIASRNIITVQAQAPDSSSSGSIPTSADSNQQTSSTSCFGGLQTFEKISMSTFENPSSNSASSFGGGILIQQDDQALTSECVNLCRSQANCLSFVIDYNKFECKSYATTQQELQQEFDAKFQAARSVNASLSINVNDTGGYQAAASTAHFQHLLPSASSNYFEKVCLDGVAPGNHFNDVCGQGRLWTIERVVDSFLDGFVEKEVTNVNNKDECSKLCIFESQFVCRSADYDQHSRLCRLSKEDRRTQPQAMRHVSGSSRQYLENQCATPGPSSCVYETKKNLGIISMDALKFAQTLQDCQMKCNQETTFNCRSYSYHQQRCFLSGDDSSSLNSNLIKLPVKQGWLFGEKKCLVELCTKGIFSYEKITGYTLRSALSTPIDLMMMPSSSSGVRIPIVGPNLDDLEKLQHESSQTRLQQLLPAYYARASNSSSNLVSTMMMAANNNNNFMMLGMADPLQESASSVRNQRNSPSNNLAITDHCRHSCDLGYLNCPAFTIDYKNNRCQRLDRNSQGRHNELVARDGFAYYEKICLRVPEIMSMCQDKYWIFERVIGYELAPRFYEKTLKFVQSRRDCEEYCLEEKQFQCRSALYNDETSDCRLSRYNRRLSVQEGGYYRNFNARISYLENQCIRDHGDEKAKKCTYESTKDEPSYPTFTEHIEMAPASPPETSSISSLEIEAPSPGNSTRHGAMYCEQLCNNNAKFECHSFGYYASTAQCFLSGDDSISVGELATTPSSGFIYYEKKCKLSTQAGSSSSNITSEVEDSSKNGSGIDHATTSGAPLNPYFQSSQNNHSRPSIGSNDNSKPGITNNNSINIHIDQRLNITRPGQKPASHLSTQPNETSKGNGPDQYKCGIGHKFVYQRISGFEPIGGYLTLLVKNNEQPGIVTDCADLCKKAFECRAFVVDYNNNQCFAMLENSSIGMLSLRQTLGKDYFEGFCISDHTLIPGLNCRNKTWIVDKIVDQAVIGVQHQKLIMSSDRAQCRLACLDERMFWCKSAMFDEATGDCKLYSIDRESMPQMRLLFTKGVDFFENQCQIMSNSCPYDAIERDMTIVTISKSVQARSTIDCELACNNEITFNCRSYTFLEEYPSLPNLCLLSADSRSTSQRGSVKEQQRTLYAERNCYYRRPRYPGGSSHKPDDYPQMQPPALADPYRPDVSGLHHHTGHSSLGSPPASYNSPTRVTGDYVSPAISASEGELNSGGTALGKECEPHQFTFERTFGYDFRLGQKERAPISPTVGIAISCQQECLRRGERCQSFVVEYALPYQSCFLMETQVGANKKLLVKSANKAYFEKVCLPRTGLDPEQLTHSPMLGSNPVDMQSMDIAPSYSHEPWAPQSAANQLPYYLQQQQLVQNYPSRSCAKLWSFERFINHNFTAPSDKLLDNILTKVQCETACLNEASFSCRAATYDYSSKVCRLFKNTRRTIMSQFVDLESWASDSHIPTITQSPVNVPSRDLQTPVGETEGLQTLQSSTAQNSINYATNQRQGGARQVSATATNGEVLSDGRNIDYMENTCVPEPSSCQYRQLYDMVSLYIDKINHAVSLSDCQRQCDFERLFSCKSVNYDPASKNCMLINEDLISLNRGQQASLMPKKNTIYSEKGNCEMISVQCNSQEMLVSINFDSPFRGRLMAKGNPEQCFLIGDGQTSIQFPIVFGPKCNSRQEGHNTFVNEVVIQQHPVIMTDNDKTVRVMCAFEAPDQTITLKNPSSRDNKTGIDVGTPAESSRTRHDKQHLNSVVSSKASPPSVLLRILDQNGRDASMINLGDDLILRIQMQGNEGQNSALGIFARNLAARSSNGESLLLIDNDGCPVDHQVFPALDVDPKDGKSLFSSFKAFRFPSSGLVNFEVQIKFCPEKCQPVDCNRGSKMRSYGRKKRETYEDETNTLIRTPIIQSRQKNPLDELSTVMKPGKAFQYVRELLLSSPPETSTTMPVLDPYYQSEANKQTPSETTKATDAINIDFNHSPELQHDESDDAISTPSTINPGGELLVDQQTADQRESDQATSRLPISSNEDSSNEFELNNNTTVQPEPRDQAPILSGSNVQSSFQKSILMHVDEKVVPSTTYTDNSRVLNQPHSSAPYGRFPIPGIELHHRRHNVPSVAPVVITPTYPQSTTTVLEDSGAKQDHKSSVRDPSVHQERGVESSMPFEGASVDGAPTKEVGSSRVEEHDVLKSNERQSAIGSSQPMSQKHVPLRFSILVGENQAANEAWVPGGPGPVLVMNSTNVEMDHIVVPGKDGQFEHITTSDSRTNQINARYPGSTQSPSTAYGGANYQAFNEIKPHVGSESQKSSTNDKRSAAQEHSFDTLPSNSIMSETDNHPMLQPNHDGIDKDKPSNSQSETAASHDCRNSDIGNSRLWTIIWAGSIVIVLNISLVVMSLILYFKKVHLSKNHNIMRATSECGTHSSTGRYKWPSVLLKSKNNLGTSLNTHEHFFCKLNSKPNGSSNNDLNWPNLSSSSSHSTISSLASPLPVTNIRINQTRPMKPSFMSDGGNSLRNDLISGQRSILEMNAFEANNVNNLHASYLDNIDKSQQEVFQGLR